MTRDQRERLGINTIQEYEEYDSDKGEFGKDACQEWLEGCDQMWEEYDHEYEEEEEEEQEVYPAVPTINPTKKGAKPYDRPEKTPPKQQQKKVEQPQPKAILKRPKVVMNPEMEIDLTGEVPQSESLKEQAKNIKKKRVYEEDIAKTIGNLVVPVRLKTLMQYSPTVKQQVKDMAIKMRPEYEEVNSISSEQARKKNKNISCAYVECHIEGNSMNAIVDTGAGPNIMTKAAMDIIGYQITKASKKAMVAANGQKMAVLGVIESVPVKIGEITTAVNFDVIDGGNYDILLGTNYLKEAKAVIYVAASKMKIMDRGG